MDRQFKSSQLQRFLLSFIVNISIAVEKKRRLSIFKYLRSRYKHQIYFQNYSIDFVTKCFTIFSIADGAQSKTVLVYIHGGGFTEGEANDQLVGPDFLLSEDNVIVVPQYRLGIFGFMNLGTSEYTGNMGLKDQQMALR